MFLLRVYSLPCRWRVDLFWVCDLMVVELVRMLYFNPTPMDTLLIWLGLGLLALWGAYAWLSGDGF